MPEKKRVAIVEDDFLIAEYLRDLCEDEVGADVIGVAHDPEEARRMLDEARPDWVLMDVRLGGDRDGVDIARELHEKAPHVKVVFVTGSNEPPTLERIEEDHPYKILIKPISPGDLVAAFR